jgi:AcrR family transcriptional regulator
MPSGRELTAPKERILQTATRLFYERGINSVGVEEIATEADTNKVTLYRHFASKEALVTEWLRSTAEKSRAIWEAIAKDHPVDGHARLRALIDMATSNIATWDRGCPFSNSYAELWSPDHAARAIIHEQFRYQRNWLEKACGDAGYENAPAAADALYYLIRGTTVGLAIDSPAEFERRERRAMLAVIDGARRKSSKRRRQARAP